jgi:hypothetical protein
VLRVFRPVIPFDFRLLFGGIVGLHISMPYLVVTEAYRLAS